jgi:hypothetical protein
MAVLGDVQHALDIQRKSVSAHEVVVSLPVTDATV